MLLQEQLAHYIPYNEQETANETIVDFIKLIHKKLIKKLDNK